MKKIRIIPVLLLKNGWLVQSRTFNTFENIGNPTYAVQRFSEWMCDEIVYLDISTDNNYDLKRSDTNYKNRKTFLDIIKDVSKVSFMPLTVGGKINSLKKIEKYLKLGADKISINTQAILDKNFVNSAAKEFGSQSIVVSVDVKKYKSNYMVMQNKPKKNITKYEVTEWVKIMEEEGAGEILLNSYDKDGLKKGYDIKLIDLVNKKLNIPLIPIGVAGKLNHFSNLLNKTKIDTIAAANFFHHYDQSYYLLKKYLFEKKYNVRKHEFNIWSK